MALHMILVGWLTLLATPICWQLLAKILHPSKLRGQEPLLVTGEWPLLGHVPQLLQQGSVYFGKLR